jgi:ADP-ribosyl-[dinitrogen reductase] hydrolase
MTSNRAILEELLAKGKIDLWRSGLFDTAPEPMPEAFDFGKVEGMMLGLAIGDALGNTSEGMPPSDRGYHYGEIRDYLPNRHAGGNAVGLPSDDTQLAFWTLGQMIEDKRFKPDRVAKRFCKDRIFGIGRSVAEFIRNFNSGKPWYDCGPRSAGNGALMRIAPMVIPHLKTATPDLWVDTALSAMLTHNDSGSTASCISFTNMLWQLLKMESSPEPEWWLETYVAVARELETGEEYRPRGGVFMGYRGPIWKLVQEKVGAAYRKNLSVVEACNSWYSGAYLLETVPSVIYILMKHGRDLEEAIVRAVSDTNDNDTIGAIVGAAVGALHGRKRIPDRWVQGLSGRTSSADDGKVFALLEAANRLWGFGK